MLPSSCPAIQGDVALQAVLLPLAIERLARCCRDDHNVVLAGHAFERLADERARRDLADDLADGAVDRLATLVRQGEAGVVGLLNLGLERGVASLVSLCFTSMMSNAQPSLSMLMKKS